MFRIGIEATGLIIQPKTGVEHYTTQLILALAKAMKKQEDISITLFLHPGNPHADAALLEHYRSHLGVFRLRYHTSPRWYRLGLETMALQERLHLLHLPMPFPPLSHAVKKITTIHDLYWETMEPSFQRAIRGAVKKADYLLAISQDTKKALIHEMRVRPEKIFTVHEGVKEGLCPSGEEACRVKQKYQLSDYFLSIGAINTRKNHNRLIEAFYELKVKRGITQHLVLAGDEGNESQSIRTMIDKLRLNEQVHILGYVPDDDLCGLYSGADIFVVPSLHEGFGLPVIEAMTCGTPVCVSRVGSLPEVAGDAALYFDPCNSDEMAEQIYLAISNSILRSTMIQKGFAHASQFTWEKTAEKTMNAYRSVVEM